LNSFVLAISGPAGAGKTTLVGRVVALLGDATALFYDDYRAVSHWHRDLLRWAQEGCDPNQYVGDPKPFADDLRALRSGVPIHRPTDQELVCPARFIVLEEPWGRDRDTVRALIDFVAHIDIPLDVSLCRRLLRDAQRGRNILEFVQDYLAEDVRQVYLRMQKGAANADLVLDGMQPADVLAQQVVTSVRAMTQTV
jgi:uridine kinase